MKRLDAAGMSLALVLLALAGSAGAADKNDAAKQACLSQCDKMVAACVDGCVAQAGQKEAAMCKKNCKEYSATSCVKLCGTTYDKPMEPKKP